MRSKIRWLGMHHVWNHLGHISFLIVEPVAASIHSGLCSLNGQIASALYKPFSESWVFPYLTVCQPVVEHYSLWTPLKCWSNNSWAVFPSTAFQAIHITPLLLCTMAETAWYPLPYSFQLCGQAPGLMVCSMGHQAPSRVILTMGPAVFLCDLAPQQHYQSWRLSDSPFTAEA